MLWGERVLVGRECRWQDVRLLGQAAVALGFAEVANGAEEVGVRTVVPAEDDNESTIFA